MTEETARNELQERFKLIEAMIAEGRRTTGGWGWAFVFWGVAYLVASAWATFARSVTAWPVTMVVAFIFCAIVAWRKRRNQPATTLGRSVSAVWTASGITFFVVLFGLAAADRYETHVFIAIISGILGLANAASSMILRWKPQLACALVWWASALAACFLTESQAGCAFLAAVFLCLVGFGLYLMIAERRLARSSEVSHA